MAKRETKAITLNDFRPQAVNANRHTQRGLGMLDRALAEDGYVAPMTATADGEIIDGSARLERAAERFDGVEPIVVDHDGTRPIIMRRTDIPNAQTQIAQRIALRANRIAELDLEWDHDIVQRLHAESPELLEDMWNGEELDELLRRDRTDEQGGVDAEPHVDRAEELRQKWGTERGQTWQVGEHKLHCGDATNPDDVATLLGGVTPLLMVTDPPYGVSYSPEWRNEAAEAGLISYAARATGKVANDDRADWSAAWALFPGNIAYVWHAGIRSAEVQASLERCGFQVRAQIVWNKSHMVISRGHYHGKHEPCFYAVRDKATASWTGDRSQMTVWDVSNQQADHTIHGTQKPVECMRRPIQNHGGKDDAVYDPFCGSGTTIIACEQLGRRCFAMELLPEYVAVALERYEEATGKTPVRITQ